MKINLGSGNKKIEGFLGVDTSLQSAVDILASATALPFKSSSISEVISRHLVEHLSPSEAESVFRETSRVLYPGKKFQFKIDRDWTKKRLLRKDPTHKHRYSLREIQSLVERASLIIENPQTFRSIFRISRFRVIFTNKIVISGRKPS
ncbi:MAG: methyltransferase domain-containing protein [Candidatus Heimdallarchaeota archaeon]